MAGKTNRQELAVSALLTEPTIEAAAAKACVSCRTLKGWSARADFAALYRAARSEVRERTVARLVLASNKAVERLERNLDSPSDPAANRAAELILANAAKGIEEADLRAELADLRRLVEELKGGRHGDARAAGGRAAEGGGEPSVPPPG
jgi:hypothetical protein